MGVIRLVVGEHSEILADRRFQLLLLANVMPPLGSALLSPVLESLIDPFGASAANIGLMMSAFSAPAIVAIPIAGVLADRHGRRPVMVFGLLCFGIAGTAISATTSFRVALALRLLQGVGFASLTPIIITSIGDLYTGSVEATAQGLRFTGSGLAQMGFPLAAGVLVTVAWQYPFLLYALAIPVAVVIFVWFEEPTDRDDTDAVDRELRDQLQQLWSLVRQRRAAAMVIARGTPNVVWIGFLTYNSILVVDVADGSPTQAGILAALGSLSYAVSATQAGRITARFDSRLWPLVAMNVTLAAGVVVVFTAATVWIAYVGVVVMGAGFGVLLSLYRSIVTDLAPVSLRGGYVSLAEGMGRLTTTVTPVAMGAGIAVATPRIGFAPSIQIVGIATGVIAAGVGIACLFVVSSAPLIRSTE
ncbi:MAG: MFS transporter [Natronomonas sp.]